MSGTGRDGDELVLEYELDAPLEKVWRALSKAEFRKRWLPDEALIDACPISSVAKEEVQYRMLDRDPPFLESIVTFQIRQMATGTLLRIIHWPDRRHSARDAAPPPLMRAA